MIKIFFYPCDFLITFASNSSKAIQEARTDDGEFRTRVPVRHTGV